MRALRLGCLALLLVACDESPTRTDGGVDAGTLQDAGPGVAPQLHLWTPGGEGGPPGAWIDSVVSASGDLGAGAWSLSAEGLPPTVAARFEPPELTAAHGALLRLDVATTAAMGFVTVKVVATQGTTRLEADLPLVISERTDLPADFVLQVRPPIRVGPTGALELSLSGTQADFPAQVLSLGGFSGEVRLLAQDPAGLLTVTPATLSVGPGTPAGATVSVRVSDEAPGQLVAVHRRQWRPAGWSGATPALQPTPGLNVLPLPRTWVRPGAEARSTVRVQAWGLSNPTFTLAPGTAPGVTATGGAFTDRAAPLTITASAGALAGPRALPLTVSTNGLQAQRSARVVVLSLTSALASPELLAPSLQRDAGTPTTAFGLDLIIDGAGLEVGRLESGWWRARESTGFAPELVDTERPAARIAGVLGGRATANVFPNTVGITETRSDVGTRPWSLPGGTGSRVALAYDASRRLWCAATVAPGVLRAWRMDAASSPTAVPVELSTGLPTQVIEGGPWLTAGVGAPTVAFVKDGVFRVLQLSGSAWSELPDVGVAAGQRPLDVALVMDDLGRPVLGWVEDAALHVKRLEGGAWVELGPVPRAPGTLPRELALVIDRGAPIVVWSEAAYEPPPQARLEALGSHVWFTRFESGAFRAPVDLQQDPDADATAVEAALGPDGKLVIAWTEDRVVVLVRGQP
jgi:hypothetical protein